MTDRGNPTVIQMVEQMLLEGGYDGLFAARMSCGCKGSDLAPCGEIGHDCRAGYQHTYAPGTCPDLHCDDRHKEHWHMEEAKR